ncbi:hypothetical protein HX045_07655 [Myroides odoratimimus]|uniref:Uncharacterized protein n=2 Tax=Myroides odoratimimus TaxID=76832 RepID=A0ABP2N6E0_9FLAO|nr:MULTISPECIES: hypothetical protein [Myroides]AJA67599.1 hypothetical protein MYRA21_0389 [Myroides sp. A21]APA90923.1 hypothetical protein BK054_01480 [Myroides sp. ZB35]EHO05768.1 hypothetical protein HMPREF9712_03344 [Myroides odoratimimus CCUG 10230]EHO06284.1 hypothetical protein HMPREF9715_03005 [Myroides odoratimimus CIP 101113]EHO06444.1 hypothetical protein HMPREF9714_02924 [Myroides odoratimimus CCUG 12901]
MASVRNLKKDIHYVLGDIIQAIYIQEMTTGGPTAETNALLEEAFVSFDELIGAVNAKNVENKKAHFKGVYKKLEDVAGQLVEKINAM